MTKHKGGRDKAIAFNQALGYNKDNYQDLIENLRENLTKYPAKLKGRNQYGDRYEVKMELIGPNGKTAKVVTGWLVGEAGKIRMVTMYVDR